MLSDVTPIFPLIAIYYAIGRQKLAVRHLVVKMRAGEGVPNSVPIEKSVLMKSNAQNLSNLNRCAFVNKVFF